ncbi:MAG: hypothetical protein WBV82_19020 [Myxococcaceae bacterium]
MARKPPLYSELSPPDDEPTELGLALPVDSDDPGPIEPEAWPGDWEDEPTHPGHPHDEDLFEDSVVGSKSVVLNPIAPEVSSGRWRERAYVPRSQLSTEDIVAGIEEAVTLAATQRGDVADVRKVLKQQLLPLLQQAVEQAGGDGIDAFLMRQANLPYSVREPLLARLVAQMDRVNQASQSKALIDSAVKLAAIVRASLDAPTVRRLSLRSLEQEFDGRIDVATFLSVLFSSDTEVEAKIGNVTRTVESLRTQLRSLPGASPEGLMSNFARLKLEKQVLEAELDRRRSGR